MLRRCLAASVSALCILTVGCASHRQGHDKAFDRSIASFVEGRFGPRKPSQGIADTGPLTLERAIRQALAASPELEQIRRRTEAASQMIRQAEAAFYPHLAFTEGFQVTDNPVMALMHIINQRRLEVGTDFNDPGRQQNVSSTVQGNWSVFEGGVRWHRRKEAIFQWRAQQAELLAARNRLIATVSETYYRWLQARRFISVAHSALDAALTNERLADARVRAQTALRSELLRLKSRTAQARQNLVTSKTSAQRLRAALERLLARPIRDEEVPDIKVPLSMASKVKAPQDPGPLVREALSKRPELEAVRAMIEAARERVAQAKGSFLPSIAVRSQYDWNSEDLSGGGNSWLFSVEATWPFFQGGLTLAKLRQARAHLAELQAKGRQVALDVALEVYHALLGLQETREKLNTASDRARWARQALEEVRAQYANQVVTVDALLQAEVESNRAQASLAAAQFDLLIARAALKRAVGEFASWTEAQHE